MKALLGCPALKYNLYNREFKSSATSGSQEAVCDINKRPDMCETQRFAQARTREGNQTTFLAGQQHRPGHHTALLCFTHGQELRCVQGEYLQQVLEDKETITNMVVALFRVLSYLWDLSRPS